jgi:hypothetical protein
LPFDPKLLPHTSQRKQMSAYQSTELERAYQQPLLAERDLGIPLLLIDPDVYDAPPGARVTLAPEDAALLAMHEAMLANVTADSLANKPTSASAAAAAAAGAAVEDAQPGQLARKRPTLQLPWLRKTEYLDHAEGLPKFKTGKVERDNAKKQQLPSGVDDGVDVHQRIEESFAAARLPPTHPDKPWLKAEATFEVLPADDELWLNEYYFVRFENDPLPSSTAQRLIEEQTSTSSQTEAPPLDGHGDKRARVSEASVRNYAAYARTHAMLRPDSTAESENFIDLYLPAASEQQPTSDVPSELHLRRAYHYQVARETKRFLLVLDAASGVAKYVPFSSRLHVKPIQNPTFGLTSHERPDVLRRAERDFDDDELRARQERLVVIEPLSNADTEHLDIDIEA